MLPKPINIFTTILTFITYLSCQIACLELEEIPGTDIQISYNDYIDQLQSYDQTLMVIVKTSEFMIYKIVDGDSIEFWGSAPHSIGNSNQDYLVSFCTHGYIAFLKKKVMYLFRLSEDKKTLQYNITFPAGYFDIDQFSKDIALNPWNNTMLMKTSTNYVHMFDFRILSKPTAILFLHDTRLAGLSSMRFIDHGRTIVLEIRHYMEIWDLDSKRRKKIMEFEADILDTSYQEQNNMIVIVLDTKNKKIIRLKTTTLDSKEVQIDDLKDHGYSNMKRLTRTGIDKAGMMFEKSVRYLDVAAEYVSECFTLPEADQKDFNLVYTYRLSNIIQAKHINLESFLINYKFFRVISKDKKLCHPSCSGNCWVPFAPCSKAYSILLSLLISVLFLMSGICLFIWILVRVQLQKIGKGKFRTTPDYKRVIRMAHFDLDEDSGKVKVSVNQRDLSQSLMSAEFLKQLPSLPDTVNDTTMNDGESSYGESSQLTF